MNLHKGFLLLNYAKGYWKCVNVFKTILNKYVLSYYLLKLYHRNVKYKNVLVPHNLKLKGYAIQNVLTSCLCPSKFICWMQAWTLTRTGGNEAKWFCWAKGWKDFIGVGGRRNYKLSLSGHWFSSWGLVEWIEKNLKENEEIEFTGGQEGASKEIWTGIK